MMDYSILLSYFEKIKGQPLDQGEEQLIQENFQKENVGKKELLFREGDTNTRHYYIEKGLLRLYIIDQSGKEFNVLFAKEKQWIGDLGTPAATSYYLEAIENSVVFSVDEVRFRSLLDHFKELAMNIRRSYVFLQKRFVSILSKTAEDNYHEFAQKYPDLLQRLPQYHISSYLGVTPVFLSKIRNKKP